MWILLFAALLALAAASPLAAQFPPDVTVGTRVRVALPDSLRQAWGWPREQWVRGSITAVATDTVYLRMSGTESPVPIRRTAIKRIDRSLGVPSRGESALRGAVTWAVWFGLNWAMIRNADDDPSWERFGDDLAEGAALGAGAGFVLGAIFPTERWRRVRVR